MIRNRFTLWLIVLFIAALIKDDLERQEKAAEEARKKAKLEAKIAEAEKEKLLKRYLLSILCYRTVKPGPSNYPCQYLEWASGVKVPGLKIKSINGSNDIGTSFVFYGKPAGSEDELFPVGVTGQVDRSVNYALELGLSDAAVMTFSALAVDFNKDEKIDLLVARSNGVWMYKNQGDGTFTKTQVYAQEKICEPYALALAEFGAEGGAVGRPVKVHLSRCVNPRWIKPVVLSGYHPHQTVSNTVDHSTGEILEENIAENFAFAESGLTSSALVDLTPGCAEPFHGKTDAMSIGMESNEFGVDPTRLDFKIQEYENFFDLYKDQILARSDRMVKYFMLREDGRVFTPDFKSKVVQSFGSSSSDQGDVDVEKKIYGGENDLFWVELIKNYYSPDEMNRLRVGLPSQSEMAGAEVFYGSQNHRLGDPLETVEFDAEENSNDRVLSVVTRLGQKYQLLNPRINCQYQLCERWNGGDTLAKMK